MNYIVTFGGRKKSKFTESENDILLSFQNMTFDQIRTFWMQLHVRLLCNRVMQIDAESEMESENGITCMCGW